MKAGSFILNGIYSEDISTVIQSRPVLDSPRRRVELKQAFGRSGLLPYDEGAYDNTELSLSLYTNGTDSAANREEVFAMFDSGSYIDLQMYSDDKKRYKVLMTEPPKFESMYYMKEGMSYEVLFTVKPYKYFIDSPMWPITMANAIANPTIQTSLPIFTVYGSGDITLIVNGISFVMTNVVDFITIDSEMMFSYKNVNGVLINQNDNIYTRKYPFFKRGSNTISWTGIVTKVEVQPKWRALT